MMNNSQKTISDKIVRDNPKSWWIAWWIFPFLKYLSRYSSIWILAYKDIEWIQIVMDDRWLHKTYSATFPGSMEEGRVEGKHEANTETAQRLLAMGLSAEQIAKATQLPLEIIKNLSNSKNSSFACKLHTLQVSEHHGIPTCPRHQKSIMSPHALKGTFGPSART